MTSQRFNALTSIALVATLAASTSTLALPLAPQTPPPAPSSNEAKALAERVKALEAELAQAKARIAELESQLAQQAAPAPNGATQPTAAPTDAEADAGKITSVAQFFAKAKAEYALAFPSSADAPPESPAALKRSLDRFAVSMNRAWKQQVRWSAILKKADRAADGTTLTVQPINEDGSARGEPIQMHVDTVRNRRLDTILQRAQPEETYTINALFIPRLTANADRMKEGVFNNPPLVGPGIEFRYEIDVDGLAIAKPTAGKDGKSGKGESKGTSKDAPAAPSAPATPTAPATTPTTPTTPPTGR